MMLSRDSPPIIVTCETTLPQQISSSLVHSTDTSTLISGTFPKNLTATTTAAANELASTNSSLLAAGRKRRAGPALELARIDFALFSAAKSGDEGSRERSAGGGEGGETKTTTAIVSVLSTLSRGGDEIAGGGDDLDSNQSAAYNSGNETPTENGDYLSGEEEQHFKRLRFNSASSSTSGSPNLFEAIVESENEERGEVNGGCGEEAAQQKLNLLELECAAESGGSTSPRSLFSNSGLVLEDELRGQHFELVGDGRHCKAVELKSAQIWHCQIVKDFGFKFIQNVLARMQSVAHCYGESEFVEKSDLLFPISQFRALRSKQRPELVYILLPEHYDTLHQMVEEECGEISAIASRLPLPSWAAGKPKCLEELRVQKILKQIATLLEFCHRIGLFFRDFRFCKFVFTDKERTKIRLNNVLDLYMVPRVDCDLMSSRELIPAYVSPEVLDKKNEFYGGKAADMWAFGVLMFTLLNGRYPFFEASHSPVALLRRIRSHHFSFPMRHGISEPARWLLHSLLLPNPDERPTAFEILEAHWFRTPDEKFHERNSLNLCSKGGCMDIDQWRTNASAPTFPCPLALRSSILVPNGEEMMQRRRIFSPQMADESLLLPSFALDRSDLGARWGGLQELRRQPRSAASTDVRRVSRALVSSNRGGEPPSFIPINHSTHVPLLAAKIKRRLEGKNRGTREEISPGDQIVP